MDAMEKIFKEFRELKQKIKEKHGDFFDDKLDEIENTIGEVEKRAKKGRA